MEAREMEPNYVNSRIGEKIKDLRNKNGLTQQELADRAELTKGYISQLERGQVAPSVVTLLDLIECLGTTPSEFFKETEEEHVVYSEGAFFEKIDEVGNSIQWIVPNAQQNQMEPLLVVVQPKEQQLSQQNGLLSQFCLAYRSLFPCRPVQHAAPERLPGLSLSLSQ